MPSNRFLAGFTLAAIAVGIVVYAHGAATQAEAPSSLSIEAAGIGAGKPLRLVGQDAHQQLLVHAMFASGLVKDSTRVVSYSATPAGIVHIDRAGVVTPRANGAATIVAKSVQGTTASLNVVVENANKIDPVNFPNQIVPIFTKLGCNGGGCHGKSSGQNGFRLSLLGFEPTEDYEHLLKEARGRRLFPASPEYSLLLLKAVGTLPHGGGKRMETDSDDYKMLVRWIVQGMPYGSPGDPTVTSIEVFPKERTMSANGEQQLVVMARYTDGSMQDVTRGALFEANDKEMGKADEGGLVKVFGQPGDVAVMVRYQARVAVFRATIPLGAAVANLPAARNFVDELVFKKLKTVGLPPSVLCDDATFVRRVTVDIAGRLPTVDEARRFLADTDPAKRDKLIEALLDSTDYADYFANKWSALLRNKRDAATQVHGSFAFHAWIRDSLLTNKPFDQFAREILAASGEIDQNPPVAWYRQVNNTTIQAEDTAQLFLGMRLKCAQCHHHPYEKWSQQDYHGFSAFFSRIGRKPGAQPGEEIIFHRRGEASATNPKNKQIVRPAGLGSPAPSLSADDDPRQALADWMARKDNPFFAKALVNRYWKHFFGRGLVEPEDDMRETNPPTNPELLDALARNFIESGFDLKNLVRTIARSQVYQLSAIPNQYNAVDKQNFSRYYPKRLTAEVLLDAVNQVTKSQNQFAGLPAGTRAVQLPDNSFNAASYFLTVFGRPDSSSACECERSQDASLAQSLHLLNSKDVQEKLTNDKAWAATLASDKQQADEMKIRELYLAAFARSPEADEMALARGHVEKKRLAAKEAKQEPAIGERQAYEDIIWALINTKEFLFNH
jgi:hypothetical protein